MLPSSADFVTLLDEVASGTDLTPEQATAVMDSMMAGDLSDIQIAGFLMAMQTKGPSAQEIAAFVSSMRAHMTPVPTTPDVVDLVGTGGDMVGTINISTIASVVAVGAGAKIGKHGNRSVSSRCGSADLVEGWGIELDLVATQVATCIQEANIGFCFAPRFHPAVRHVMPARQGLKVPTVFNILGPLCNPIGNVHQTIGVAFPKLAPLMAETLVHLKAPHSMVFLGNDGLDELTISGLSQVWEIKDGLINHYEFDPREYGIEFASVQSLLGGEVGTNIALAEKILQGEKGPQRDAVTLAAAAAIIVAGKAEDWQVGIDLARESIDSGAALAARNKWVEVSSQFGE